MALTADQITAQNFKDFYGQIRPYLNGQVPTFANAFDRSDLYSETEKIVGSWIDGKPLYQRTVDCGTLPDKTNKYVNISADSLSIDRVVFMAGYAYAPTTNVLIPIPYIRPDNVSSEMLLDIRDINTTTPKIHLASNTSYTLYTESYVTIQYTKTSDSAIKVGTGNDYSTDEQIIGTWIDGKPIYQRSFELSVPTVSAKTSSVYNMTTDTTLKLVDGSGVVIRSDGLRWPLPVTAEDVDNGAVAYGFRIAQEAAGNIGLMYKAHVAQSKAWTAYCTIRYTKTTD